MTGELVAENGHSVDGATTVEVSFELFCSCTVIDLEPKVPHSSPGHEFERVTVLVLYMTLSYVADVY